MIGKILGVFGLLTGSIGFTAEICMGRKNQILLLKEIREMFCLIQGEIDYTALPLPEIFRNLSEKIKEPLSGALREAAGRLTMEQGDGKGACFLSFVREPETDPVFLSGRICRKRIQRTGKSDRPVHKGYGS